MVDQTTDEIIVVCDVDAFPMMRGWDDFVLRELATKDAVGAIVHIPDRGISTVLHPCFLAFRRSLLEAHKLDLLRRVDDDPCYRITEWLLANGRFHEGGDTYPHAQQVAADASLGGRRRHGFGPGLYASERPFQILEALGRRVGFPVQLAPPLPRTRRTRYASLWPTISITRQRAQTCSPPGSSPACSSTNSSLAPREAGSPVGSRPDGRGPRSTLAAGRPAAETSRAPGLGTDQQLSSFAAAFVQRIAGPLLKSESGSDQFFATLERSGRWRTMLASIWRQWS